jgi:hypothetical protein
VIVSGEVCQELGVVEVSEWFDWMRREIGRGGIDLPNEEIAVSLAGHALRLRDRIRDVYRHLPASLEDRLIRSAIVYQCWELQRSLHSNAKWPGANRVGPLVAVEAVRYVRPIGGKWGYHLVEARDGFQYVVTVPTGFFDETVPATEAICNGLARLLGLNVPTAAIVSVEAALLRHCHCTRPGRPHRAARRAPELCAGFRYVDPPPSDEPLQDKQLPLSRRNERHLVGALVFDTWTLNLSPRRWTLAFSKATGRIESTLVSDSGGLAGGDWARFLDASYQSLPAVQVIASKVKRWEQIDPWLRRIAGMNLNPIWELAFQMPTLWYGGCRPGLANVLGKLSMRQWDLARALHHFVQVGYLPSLKMPRSRAAAGPEAGAPISRRSA